MQAIAITLTAKTPITLDTMDTAAAITKALKDVFTSLTADGHAVEISQSIVEIDGTAPTKAPVTKVTKLTKVVKETPPAVEAKGVGDIIQPAKAEAKAETPAVVEAKAEGEAAPTAISPAVAAARALLAGNKAA